MTKKNRAKKKSAAVQLQDTYSVWLQKAVLISAGLLIFYPPFIQGLYFSQDMFVYHIVTGFVFILVWMDKLARRDYTFFRTPLDWAILAYAGAYLLSLIGAVHPGEAIYGFLRGVKLFYGLLDCKPDMQGLSTIFENIDGAAGGGSRGGRDRNPGSNRIFVDCGSLYRRTH